jgi:hypothetical protein
LLAQETKDCIGCKDVNPLVQMDYLSVWSRIDRLKGPKENVILGEIIPVGTKFKGLIFITIYIIQYFNLERE